MCLHVLQKPDPDSELSQTLNSPWQLHYNLKKWSKLLLINTEQPLQLIKIYHVVSLTISLNLTTFQKAGQLIKI